MTDFRTYYDKMMKVTEGQRIALAQQSIKNFKATAKMINLDPTVVNQMILDFLKLFICADKKTGLNERIMFNKIMGNEFSKDEFMELIAGGTKTVFRIKMKDTARRLSPIMRNEMINVAAAILCCDNELGEEEERLMNEIFN